MLEKTVGAKTFRCFYNNFLKEFRKEEIYDLEAAIGIEPMNKAFAELCLTTWLRRRFVYGAGEYFKKTQFAS